MERALGAELLLLPLQGHRVPSALLASLLTFNHPEVQVSEVTFPYKSLIIWQKKHLSIILALRTVK